MSHRPKGEFYDERIVVSFSRHGRGYQRQADFEVDVFFDDVLALLSKFAEAGHVRAKLLVSNARATEAFEHVRAAVEEASVLLAMDQTKEQADA